MHHQKKQKKFKQQLNKNILQRRFENSISYPLIRTILRSSLKKSNLSVKKLAKLSNIPLSTMRVYLAPHVYQNIPTKRAKTILEMLKSNTHRKHLLELEKIINSYIYWDKLKYVKRIKEPQADTILKLNVPKDKMTISNLIFTS